VMRSDHRADFLTRILTAAIRMQHDVGGWLTMHECLL
jgi:hypothetical protein